LFKKQNMISGELEYIQGQASGDDYEYDYFFKKLFGKKTAEEKEARKKKRKAFWASIGQGYQELGGAAGIIGTAQGVKDLVQPGEEDSDFEVGVGHSKEEEPETTEKDKGIPKEVLIIGGIAVFAVGIWGYSHYRKNQAIKKLSIQNNQ